jgi:hypothetical protein
VFNATFNNISAISWRSVLLVEETTDLPQVTDKLYHIMLYTSPWAGVEPTTSVVMAIGIDCKFSCKSNYHTITNMMVLHFYILTSWLKLTHWFHFKFFLIFQIHTIINTLWVHVIKKSLCDWSKGWHVTKELKLHQPMKCMTMKIKKIKIANIHRKLTNQK